MYLSSRASRIRQREAHHARANRAEIIKALSIGSDNQTGLIPLGNFHEQWTAGLQDRPEPIRTQCFRSGPYRNAAKSPL